MASSGTFSVSTSNSRVVGDVMWKETAQSIDNNTTTVYAEMRLWRNNTGYTTYGTGDFFVTINGVKHSANSKSFTLTYNSDTLIVSGTTTVTHNSDGSKSITIGWGGDSDVFNVYDSSGTATLDTIPRASKLSDTTPSLTAGSDVTLNLTVYSSKFRHEAEIYVLTGGGAWDWVKRVDFSAGDTSQSTSFSVDEKEEIFRILNGASSAKMRVLLQTYNGTTFIGDNDYTNGLVTAPEASTASIANPTGVSSAGQPSSTVWIDQTITINVSRKDGEFNHTLKFKDGNTGTVIHTATNVGTSYSWTPNLDEKNALYSKIPNDVELDGQLDIYTYYRNTLVRTVRDMDINYRVRNSNPSFPNANISYEDINTTTTGVTGNNQYIVQNKSTLRAKVNTPATPQNYATITKYNISVDGLTDSLTATGYKDMGVITNSQNVTLTITAVDSRGFTATATKTVTVVPYSNPIATVSALRLNNFEESTTLSLKGSVSALNVGGTNKNAILSAKYSWKLTTQSTYPTGQVDKSFTVTGFPNYTATDVPLTLDNLQSWHVQVVVTDKLGTTTITKTVSTGQPILFIDSESKKVGINAFPSTRDLEIGGSSGHVKLTGVYGKYIDDYILLDHGNGNVTLSALGNDLYLGYKNTKRLILSAPISNSIPMTDGTNTYNAIEVVGGTSTGIGLKFGAGGTVYVGGGESANTMATGLGWNGDNENTFITSDNTVYITTALQNGFSGRYTWEFTSGGNLQFPNANSVYLNQYGNILAPSGITSSATWGVYDSAGGQIVRIPVHSSNYTGLQNSGIYLGQHQFYGNRGPAGDESAISVLVFRMYSTSNREFLLVDDATNGFYFGADQALPGQGDVGTGNGNLYAAKYNVVSDREQKENIEEFNVRALDKIKGVKTYKYEHKMSESKKSRNQARGVKQKKSLGLIAQEVPEEIKSDSKSGEGIDLYAMNTLLWKAVQELSEQVDFLEKKLKQR